MESGGLATLFYFYSRVLISWYYFCLVLDILRTFQSLGVLGLLVVLSTLLVIRLTYLLSKGFEYLGEDILWGVVV